MLLNLLTGTLMVAATVLIHTSGLLTLAHLTPRVAHKLRLHSNDFGRSVVMTGSVMGIFFLHTIEIWIWAATYWYVGAARPFAEALDLSTAMFSTLGYGGIAITSNWRLLSALEGINGFILIGWSTAYLVGVSTRHGPFREREHF